VTTAVALAAGVVIGMLSPYVLFGGALFAMNAMRLAKKRGT
jgi:hypothetical protein